MENKLIKCSACGHDLAITAPKCPHCGGLNDYIHPEIKRFTESERPFPELEYAYRYGRYSIVFYKKAPIPFWKIHWHLKEYFACEILFIIFYFVPPIVYPSSFAAIFLSSLMQILINVNLGILILGYIVYSVVSNDDKDTGEPWPQYKYLIDFQHDPPKVETNAPEYWKDIDAYFKAKPKDIDIPKKDEVA